MDFNEYQEFTETTASYPKDKAFEYVILGLTGEAGELCNKYKKVLRDDNQLLSREKKEELIKELGDVLWYAARLATELDVSLELVAIENVKKLSSRKERGVIGGSGDNR